MKKVNKKEKTEKKKILYYLSKGRDAKGKVSREAFSVTFIASNKSNLPKAK